MKQVTDTTLTFCTSLVYWPYRAEEPLFFYSSSSSCCRPCRLPLLHLQRGEEEARLEINELTPPIPVNISSATLNVNNTY